MKPGVLSFAIVLLLCVVARAAPVPHDGRHDFDFETGTWRIQVHRLVHPLTGSHEWVSPTGYVHIVRPVWGGRASLAQLEVTTPARRYLGLMLRLYNARLHRWSIYWAASDGDTVDPPLTGTFSSGRGEFRNQDTYGGKRIDVRVVYWDIRPASFRTEQSFSADGGKTWEANLIQTFARIR